MGRQYPIFLIAIVIVVQRLVVQTLLLQLILFEQGPAAGLQQTPYIPLWTRLSSVVYQPLSLLIPLPK
jgi:hypothetical protein